MEGTVLKSEIDSRYTKPSQAPFRPRSVILDSPTITWSHRSALSPVFRTVRDATETETVSGETASGATVYRARSDRMGAIHVRTPPCFRRTSHYGYQTDTSFESSVPHCDVTGSNASHRALLYVRATPGRACRSAYTPIRRSLRETPHRFIISLSCHSPLSHQTPPPPTDDDHQTPVDPFALSLCQTPYKTHLRAPR
jgi:hypothetical protein